MYCIHTHTYSCTHCMKGRGRTTSTPGGHCTVYSVHYELRNTEGSTPCTARAPQRECSTAAPSVQLHARPPCAQRTPTHHSHTRQRSATAVCHRHSAAVSGTSAAVTVVGWALPLPRSVWVCRASAASICGRVYTCGYTWAGIYVCIYACVYPGGLYLPPVDADPSLLAC